MICDVQSMNPNRSLDKNSLVWPMRLVRLSESSIVEAMCRQVLFLSFFLCLELQR